MVIINKQQENFLKKTLTPKEKINFLKLNKASSRDIGSLALEGEVQRQKKSRKKKKSSEDINIFDIGEIM